MSSSAVFVSGLPTSANERDVVRHFSKVGEVDGVFLVRDPSGLTGNAFVVFKSVSDQQTAITDTDSAKFGTKNLVVRNLTSDEITDLNTILSDKKKKSTPDDVRKSIGNMSPDTMRRTMDILNKEFDGRRSTVRLTLGTGEDTEIPPGTQLVLEQPKHHFHRKLRHFSGKKQPANGEVDFRQWRISATQVLEDEHMTAWEKVNCLKASLVGNAYDDIRDVTSSYGHTAQDIFDRLVSIYGDRRDRHDMKTEFYNCFYKEEEKPSEYLRRLFKMLQEMLEERFIDKTEVMELLVVQFDRGYPDETFLYKFKADPPCNYDKFLDRVLTEEKKMADKKERFKATNSKNEKHSSKKEARSQQQDVTVEDKVESLQKTVSDLANLMQQQVKFNQQSAGTYNKNEAGAFRKSTEQKSSKAKNNNFTPKKKWDTNKSKQFKGKHQGDKKPKRRYFCYNCGEDDHMRSDCSNEKNESLVFKRLNDLN